MTLLICKKRIRLHIDKLNFFYKASCIRITYRIGKFLFSKKRKKGMPLIPGIGVMMIKDGYRENFIVLPSDYHKLIDELSEQVKEKFLYTKNCRLRSADEKINQKISQGNLPALLADISEIQQGFISTIRLSDTSDIPSIVKIANILIPQIEDLLYHAPVIVEKATVYRHMPSVLEEYASILWHADNHFREVTKIMIYINDVTEKQAPFEYLRHSKTHETIYVSPSMPQKYPSGRIPKEVIDTYMKQGYESYKVTGKKGTTMIFDDKIIHKGNYAQEGMRDVLVLQLRPVLTSREYINYNWTTSF